MKNKMPALIILGCIQIITAILILISSVTPDIIGLKTLGGELSIYRYVISSLYFALGVLFLIGSVKKEYYRAALFIASIDVLLEVVSYWFGFTLIPIPYWLIAIFSICIAVPGLICFMELMKLRRQQQN